MRSSKPIVAATFVAVGIFFGGALWRKASRPRAKTGGRARDADGDRALPEPGHRRPAQSAVLTAIPAVDRWRRQAAVDPAARRLGRSMRVTCTNGRFPTGTKVWKEFSFGGRKVETRFLWKTGERLVGVCQLRVER